MTQYAYTWEINGKKALNPGQLESDAERAGFEIVTDEPMIVIRTERGCQPALSRLLMRKEDADEILVSGGPVSIEVNEYQRAENGSWSVSDSWEFQQFYPLRCSAAFGLDKRQVILEIADAKHDLVTKQVRKKFNIVLRREGDDGEEVLDEETINGTQLWTYEEIVQQLFAEASTPPSIALPISPPNPRNLVFECSLADAIDQVLASIGCIAVFDVFNGTWEVRNLGESQDLSALNQAKQDKRLTVTREPSDSDLSIPSAVKVRASQISRIGYFAKVLTDIDEVSDAGGGNVVAIDDHEFEPDESRILSAIESWYGSKDDRFDDQYFGIISIAPGETVTHVEWAFSAEGTFTRVRRRISREIPWPKQPTLTTAAVSDIVLIMSDVPDGDGYFPGIIQRYNHDTRSWYHAGACLVLDANL